MIRDIARLVALWRPPQRVEDGKLMAEQIDISAIQLARQDNGTILVRIEAREPMLGDHVHASMIVSPELIAEKKAALGHHIVNSLHDGFRDAVAAHPRAAEAIPFHHHMRPR
jgi:hypothetical protein